MKNSTHRAHFREPFQENHSKESQVLVDGHYYLKSLKERNQNYRFYKGIDVLKQKWVNIYCKQTENDFKMSKKVKQLFRNQLCPRVIWSGEEKVENTTYCFQVHQKYGPSLRTMFQRIKASLTQKQLLHLLYQMIKLIERMNNAKLVSGQLDPDLIVFDCSPKKNQLFLLNCFTLKKRNTQVKPMYSKYCSIGMHLGRNIGAKDDLESLCYILIDLYTQGAFLKDKLPFQYQEEKMKENIELIGKKMPKVFIDFYTYIINLNYNEEANFLHWKALLGKVLGSQILCQPYSFMMTKSKKHIETYSKLQITQKDISNTEDDEAQFDEDLTADKQNNIIKLGRVIVPKLIVRDMAC